MRIPVPVNVIEDNKIQCNIITVGNINIRTIKGNNLTRINIIPLYGKDGVSYSMFKLITIPNYIELTDIEAYMELKDGHVIITINIGGNYKIISKYDLTNETLYIIYFDLMCDCTKEAELYTDINGECCIIVGDNQVAKYNKSCKSWIIKDILKFSDSITYKED